MFKTWKRKWQKFKLAEWVAYRLPVSVVYWALIRALAHATSYQWSNQIVPRMTALEMITRWEQPHKKPPAYPPEHPNCRCTVTPIGTKSCGSPEGHCNCVER